MRIWPKRVYREIGLSRNESADLVETVLREMSDSLARGESVKISSFGSFSVRQKGARVGRNPKTGEEVPILPAQGAGVPRLQRAQVENQRIDGGPPGPATRIRPAAEPWRKRQQPVEARRRGAGKSAAAFRTISEVAGELDVPQHVLRFWESKFIQVKPMKRGGGRRYYRPEDIDLLRSIRELLYTDGYTIKGVQKLLREGGVKALAERRNSPAPPAEPEPRARPEAVPGGDSRPRRPMRPRSRR